MINVTDVRHAYPEKSGFCIDRKKGHPEYTFLHFFESINIMYGGKLIKTEPHSVIIYDKRTPQYFESPNADLTHDWFHFDGEIGDFLEKYGIELNVLYYPNQSEFITDLVKEIEIEYFRTGGCFNELTELKSKELFIKLGRAIRNETEPIFDYKVTEKFRYLRGEMFSTLNMRWTVDRMAESVGFSQSRFYSIYRSIYGVSPTADLIRAKIGNAENMLAFGNRSVEEIAFLLGYENTTHFIRQFKSRTGVSPSKYRKDHRK